LRIEAFRGALARLVEQATEARTTVLTMLSAARSRMIGLKSAYEDLCVVYDWDPGGTKRD